MKLGFLQICIWRLCSPLESLMSKQHDCTSASPLIDLEFSASSWPTISTKLVEVYYCFYIFTFLTILDEISSHVHKWWSWHAMGEYWEGMARNQGGNLLLHTWELEKRKSCTSNGKSHCHEKNSSLEKSAFQQPESKTLLCPPQKWSESHCWEQRKELQAQ